MFVKEKNLDRSVLTISFSFVDMKFDFDFKVLFHYKGSFVFMIFYRNFHAGNSKCGETFKEVVEKCPNRCVCVHVCLY